MRGNGAKRVLDSDLTSWLLLLLLRLWWQWFHSGISQPSGRLWGTKSPKVNKVNKKNKKNRSSYQPGLKVATDHAFC